MKLMIVSARPLWAHVFSEYLLKLGHVPEVLLPASMAWEAEPADAVIIDCVQLPAPFPLIQRIGAGRPELRILSIVSRPSDYLVLRARQAGCHAVLSETDSGTCLERVLRRLQGIVFQTGLSFTNAPAVLPILTPRQLVVFDCILRGASDAEIANELEIAVATAETHRAAVQRKLGCGGHAAVMSHALRLGIIDPSELPERSPYRQASRRHAAVV